MSIELIFGALVVVSTLVALGSKLLPKRRPPVPVFKCARCGEATRHDDRTTEAWRLGKARFFCRPCHASWLASQPHRGAAGRGMSSRSGCLGVVALFALFPLGSLLAWAFG